MARRDWIHWITSARQPETRALRIKNAFKEGNDSQLLVRLSKCGVEAFEAGFGPEIARLVVIPERRRSFRQLEPLHFPAGEDVHVRLQGARLVECADAHESEIGPMPVVTPDGGLTLGAAVDIV